ncbi:hypothetical protein [Marinimicrobium agarilyticum]|uniref:hypothetical protein n=1 Tax=Marinimicrobium agarilyticum TaxID=306546 RepID=UPI00047F428A|nr:hypothetical protein [Marinimicrobium agarilyticum]
MTDALSFGEEHTDSEWDCSYFQLNVPASTLEKISLCHVHVSNLSKLANELAKSVMDKSWIMELDEGVALAYQQTVEETAEALTEIFSSDTHVNNEGISGEFGEIMVSMGASRALEFVFSHLSLPIAELWKPKLKGNEGFDFHTICPENLINFGEAKYSSTKNPYGGNTGDTDGAAGQTDGFIKAEKHLRDYVHLMHLAEGKPSDNLKKKNFGAILSFSMNAKKPLSVYSNAINAILELPHLLTAERIYLVGVSHDN